jgi:flavin-dependent dehydrogenase
LTRDSHIDESGWAWLIPVHNGTTSVGIVMDIKVSSEKRSKASRGSTLKDHYLEQLNSMVPNIKGFLQGATLNEGGEGDYYDIKSTSDYSYSADAYSGDHYRIIGDAAGEVIR